MDYPQGIPECGTDALRFALVSYTAQGTTRIYSSYFEDVSLVEFMYSYTAQGTTHIYSSYFEDVSLVEFMYS